MTKERAEDEEGLAYAGRGEPEKQDGSKYDRGAVGIAEGWPPPARNAGSRGHLAAASSLPTGCQSGVAHIRKIGFNLCW